MRLSYGARALDLSIIYHIDTVRNRIQIDVIQQSICSNYTYMRRYKIIACAVTYITSEQHHGDLNKIMR